MGKEEANLTDKQIRFCQEYVIDLKQGEAYKRAGYKAKNDKVAWTCASKLLSFAKVKNYINKLQKPFVEKSHNLKEMVIEELKILSFSDIGNFINSKGHFMSLKEIKELPLDLSRSIEYIEETKYGLKIRMVKKTTALEMLGRHIGVFDMDDKKPTDPFDYLHGKSERELVEMLHRLERNVPEVDDKTFDDLLDPNYPAR